MLLLSSFLLTAFLKSRLRWINIKCAMMTILNCHLCRKSIISLSKLFNLFGCFFKTICLAVKSYVTVHSFSFLPYCKNLCLALLYRFFFAGNPYHDKICAYLPYRTTCNPYSG